MLRSLQTFRDENGQTTVFTAICMLVLISFLGLTIDFGHLRQVRRQMQTAADAAAIAAGLEIRVCGAATNCSAMNTAAQNALAENGLTGSTVIDNCSGSAAGGLVVMINTPPCALGSGDPNAGRSGYVEVEVTQTVRTYFARIAGFDNVPVTARSEVRRGGSPCIYALDPSGVGAITAAAGINSTCSIVDESSSPLAAACAAGLFAAPKIMITGGALGLLCASPTKVQTGVATPSPADPLAYLPKPVMPNCGSSTKSPFHGAPGVLAITQLSGPVVLYPDGAYCGGITIAANSNVTLMPGTYTIRSTSILGLPLAGGLTVSALSQVTGSGVTFYNYGPTGSILFPATDVLGLLGNIHLSAPTSGNYKGILFFQDPGNSSLATIAASSSLGSHLEGGFYLPSATLSYAVATPASYTILVAKDLIFAATLTLNSDFSSLENGSPINGDDVQLIQ